MIQKRSPVTSAPRADTKRIKIMTNFKRKNIRLKEFDYMHGYAYFVTINTNLRTKYFAIHETAQMIKTELEHRNSTGEITLLCYCIMPDHLHLLLALGENYQKNLSNWVSAFKRYTSRLAKQLFEIDKLWHINYYDHVVRKEESLAGIADYIMQNPVRKNLAEKWEEYPYCKIL